MRTAIDEAAAPAHDASAAGTATTAGGDGSSCRKPTNTNSMCVAARQHNCAGRHACVGGSGDHNTSLGGDGECAGHGCGN